MFKWLMMSLVLLSACGSVDITDLKEPQQRHYFTLAQPYVRTSFHGIGNSVKRIEGLKAGVYTSIGENSEGTYYSGEGDAVIMLMNDLADQYQANGTIPDYHYRFTHEILAGGEGGLWLPKPGSSKPPRLFFVRRVPEDVATSLNLTFYILSHMSDGNVIFVDYNEKPLLDNLQILAK